jgi:hypothetical protein
MSYDPSRIVYYLIEETVEGVTPSTGTAYKLAHTPGSGPTYNEETVTSEALYSKRQSGGAYTVGGEVGGSFDFELRRSAAMDLVLAGSASGEWIGGSLAAGDTDTSYTIIGTTGESGAPKYQAWTGCQFSELSLSADTRAIMTGSVTIIGMGYISPDDFDLGEIELVEDSPAAPINSKEVTATVGLLPGIRLRSSAQTVSHEREAQAALGPVSTIGIGTSGARTVTQALEFYRRDFTPETALKGNAETSVIVNYGSGARGYIFEMPACTGSWPEQSVDGSSLVVTVTFTGKVNAAGDLTIRHTA